jgi:O-antigen ligase
MVFLTFCALIFVRPLVSSMAFPWADAALSVCFLASALIWMLRRGSPMTTAAKPAGLLPLFFLLSVLPSFTGTVSLFNLSSIALGITLFAIASSLCGKERDTLLGFIIASAAVISFAALYQFFFGFSRIRQHIDQTALWPFVKDYFLHKRAFLPFVTANALAGFLAMALPLTLIKKEHRLLAIPAAAALLSTQSMGALFSLGTAYVLTAVLWGRKRNLFLGLILLGTALPAVWLARSGNTLALSGLSRLNYWKDALALIVSHPLLGNGLGSFSIPGSLFAHNSYLQIWAESGVFPLAILLAFLYKLFTGTLPPSREQKTLHTALLAFCLHNLFDMTWYLPEISMIWWAIAGMAWAYSDEPTKRR